MIAFSKDTQFWRKIAALLVLNLLYITKSENEALLITKLSSKSGNPKTLLLTLRFAQLVWTYLNT